jgi:hypothetical protein
MSHLYESTKATWGGLNTIIRLITVHSPRKLLSLFETSNAWRRAETRRVLGLSISYPSDPAFYPISQHGLMLFQRNIQPL